MTDQDDEREIDRIMKRAQKKAAKLRGKSDLLERSRIAHQRVAACGQRVNRLVPILVQGKGKATAHELDKAVRDMCKASDEELAVLCAMNDDEEEQYVEACHQFEKLRSIAKKLPSV